MKGLRIVLLVALIVTALSLIGCGGKPADAQGTGGEEDKSANPLVGKWVGNSGELIEYTSDVFLTDPEDSDGDRRRYTIVDDKTFSWVAIRNDDGIEVDDTGSPHTQLYKVDGDTLTLANYRSVNYYRVGSKLGDEVSAEAPAVRACEDLRSKMVRGVYAGEKGEPVDDEVIKRLMDEGFSASELKCAQGGVFTWKGGDSGDLSCSVHSDR